LFYDLENLAWLKMCRDPLGKKVSGCWTMEALVCSEGRITFLGVMEIKLGDSGGIGCSKKQTIVNIFLRKFGAL
jgi:hypothetical protein